MQSGPFPGGRRRGALSRRGFLTASMLLGGGVAGVGWTAERSSPARGVTPDVRDFGAVGDGRIKDTRAIQQAIDAVHELGGGIVQLPAGRWLSGTLVLRSRVTIDLAPGAVLLASPDDDDFAPREALPFESDSDVETIDFARALLAGHDLEQIAIRGAGVIDMNRDRRSGPKPIALKRCRFATVQGITIVRSPNYCVSLGGCEDVLVEGVTIRTAYADGIDPDCCRRVRIANCDVESDDDALCLKASFLLGVRGTTEDVVVTNCRLCSPSNCFKLGTESTGDFRQIVLSNCVFDGSPPKDHDASAAAEGGGIAILMVDGGTIDGVMISNVVMRDVPAPLFVRLGDRGRDQPQSTPGRLRNVVISGVMAVGATGTGSIAGLPGHPIHGVTVENVQITTVGGSRQRVGLDVPERSARYPRVTMYGILPAFGLYLRHARDVSLRNLDLRAEHPDARPALVADDVTELHVARLTGRPAKGEAPVLWLNDVQGGLVESGIARAGAGVFLRVTGENTQRVTLAGHASWTPECMDLAPEVAPTAVMHAMGSFAIARQ
jgi:glycosyl hydrolase family 28/pectate lyase-like protein